MLEAETPREVDVSVAVDDEGAPRVMTSESAAALVDSLFVVSSSCLTYAYVVADIPL